MNRPISAEAGSITVEAAEIAYTVVRSKRRKRTIEIRVDPQRGVLVAVPRRTPAAEVAELVRRRAGWILRRASELAHRPEPKQLLSGESLPYLGGQVSLLVEPGEAKHVSVNFDGPGITVFVPGNLDGDERRLAVAAGLERWYRGRAAEDLGARVALWWPVVGSEPRDVLVCDQRRRWGSCSADGMLRFNWRLVQLDPVLIDYVVVHELAHLRVRDHSARFWAEVGRVQPDFALRRQRLRRASGMVVL